MVESGWIGARTAMSARSWLQFKFARTRLSALLSRPLHGRIEFALFADGCFLSQCVGGAQARQTQASPWRPTAGEDARSRDFSPPANPAWSYFPVAATLSPSLMGTGLKAVTNLPTGSSKIRTLPS